MQHGQNQFLRVFQNPQSSCSNPVFVPAPLCYISTFQATARSSVRSETSSRRRQGGSQRGRRRRACANNSSPQPMGSVAVPEQAVPGSLCELHSANHANSEEDSGKSGFTNPQKKKRKSREKKTWKQDNYVFITQANNASWVGFAEKSNLLACFKHAKTLKMFKRN